MSPNLSKILTLALSVSCITSPLVAAPFIVTSAADTGPNTLRAAIETANTNIDGSNSITFDAAMMGTTTIILASPLFLNMDAAGVPQTKTISIDGTVGLNKITINGGTNSTRAFFVRGGMSVTSTATISNLILGSPVAQGGNGGGGNCIGGGGGGGGLGGAIFINEYAAVTLTNLSITASSALGGNGGDAITSILRLSGGGGGGMGGDGGTQTGVPASSGEAPWGAGGGGGITFDGGNGGTNVSSTGGGGGGGAGLNGNGVDGMMTTGGAGGTGGGGAGTAGSIGAIAVGSGGAGTFFGAGGGGTGGSTGAANAGVQGGLGNFGGGGGGVAIYSSAGGARGGNGGFGGGGGGGARDSGIDSTPGGSGGFGGGGGGNNGVGGFGGGTGGNIGISGPTNFGGSGGGGAALGGAIFIQDNSTLTINDGTIASSTITAGSGGTTSNPGTNGQAIGQDIFLMSGTTGGALICDIGGATSVTIKLDGGGSGTQGSLTKQGTGTLVLAPPSTGSMSYNNTILVSAGTLEGTTATLLGDINNSGLVLFNQTTSGSYAGTSMGIFGSGAVQKNNSGTVSFTVANTYTGGTVVGGGTLQAQNASAFPNNTGFNVNAGTLDLAGGNMGMSSLTMTTLSGFGTITLGTAALTVNRGTYSGGISGAGSLTKATAGTLTLTGTNTYSGGTTISAGILRGNTNSLQGNILNNSGTLDALDFVQNTPGTFVGSVSGSGGLTMSGSALLSLLGTTNTYLGPTHVAMGSLEADVASLPVSTPITIDSGANMDFAQNTNATFTGSITGMGNLSMTGSATLSLSTPVTLNAASSLVDVTSGRLNVNSTMTANAVIVSGILGGIGTINAPVTVFSGGTLSPGTSPGTLTVSSATFNSGSFFGVEIENTTASKLVTTAAGGVTIQSDVTVNVIPLGMQFPSSATYDIVQTTGAGSVSGTFNPTVNVIGPFPYLNFQIVYPSATLVQLLLNQIPFDVIVPTGNAGEVAKAFDKLTLNDPDIAFLNDFLNMTTPSQLQCDFDQMHTARFNAVPIAQEMATLAVRASLTDRLHEIHGPACERKLFEKESTGLFLTPIANYIKQSPRSQHGECDQTKVGFNADTYGVTFGASGAFTDYCVVGGALSYAHTSLHWKEAMGHNYANCGFASTFATFFNNLGYVDVALIGGYDSYEGKRNIRLVNQVSQLKRTAKHDNSAGEVDAHVGIGYTLNRPQQDEKLCWQLSPFFDVDYIYMVESGYHERGAQSIDLNVRSKSSDLLREEVGLQFSTWHVKSWFEWSEELHLSYVHEERFKGKKTTEQFTEDTFANDAIFTVKGFLPDRDLIAPGVSMSFFLPKSNFMVSARYQGEFGNKWKNQTGSFEFLWSF